MIILQKIDFSNFSFTNSLNIFNDFFLLLFSVNILITYESRLLEVFFIGIESYDRKKEGREKEEGKEREKKKISKSILRDKLSGGWGSIKYILK